MLFHWNTKPNKKKKNKACARSKMIISIWWHFVVVTLQMNHSIGFFGKNVEYSRNKINTRNTYSEFKLEVKGAHQMCDMSWYDDASQNHLRSSIGALESFLHTFIFIPLIESFIDKGQAKCKHAHTSVIIQFLSKWRMSSFLTAFFLFLNLKGNHRQLRTVLRIFFCDVMMMKKKFHNSANFFSSSSSSFHVIREFKLKWRRICCL